MNPIEISDNRNDEEQPMMTNSDKVYYQQDWNFVSVTDGIGKDRAGDHESNPKYATPTEKTLDGNYAIIGICED